MASATSTITATPRKDSRYAAQVSPRRLGPDEHGSEKENDAASGRRMAQAPRRMRATRISDRWPVLHKLMRARASTTSRPSSPSPSIESDDGNEDEDEDEDTVVVPSFTRRRLLASQPTYPKFPSPLSGISSFQKRLPIARHNYIHRGYSLAAIHAQRELWRKRKFEWDEYEQLLWQYGMRLEEAYGGIVESSEGEVQGSQPLPPFKLDELRGAQHLSETTITSGNEEPLSSSSNPAVFPRLGDLSSIRDPFLISVDTWFGDFPLWTLSKLIWIYDVNYRSDKGENSSIPRALVCDSGESTPTSDVSTESSITTISTSSDETLVPEDARQQPDSPIVNLELSKEQHKEHSDSPSCETICAPEDKRGRGWETNWFLRWETLYHQVSLATDLASSSSDRTSQRNSGKVATRIILTSPKVLYDPNADDLIPTVEVTPEIEDAQIRSVSIPNVILPAEDEEEDYGDVITSKYRLGAHVDPLSMFATAQPEYLEDDLDGGDNAGVNECQADGAELGDLTDSVDRLNVSC